MLTRASLTASDLARVLEQSTDCVKLLDCNGNLIWMNANGLCAMEIDSFTQIADMRWAGLWPDVLQPDIENAFRSARAGETARFRGACPTAKNDPRWWEVSITQVCDDAGRPIGFLSISRDVTQAENDREALRVMIGEMRHRLRNSYTIVCSLLRRFAGHNPQLGEFVADMELRIMALARAQSLFDDDATPADLRELIEMLVTPFYGAAEDCFTLDIPPGLALDRRAADAVALVIGELCVNSAKYGAVSQGGRIGLHWRGSPGELRLEWVEHASLPASALPGGRGQGLRLIGRIVKTCAGTFNMQWRADGVTAAIFLPLSA
ncbi:hypothetical protein B0W47_01485 [Komagataeibacter nataicola]|uniref:histidine kinase n=1 Tax=Komagataeibacter nataicola TaxID=265960 RepID=A0A9N7H219_9PROT|nr:PAS domain-containing protein [Komagataeibacter nataicola]AQU86343.1 hypothetical protein B0W47_01485 [Komagataeibacter nataicola]PYD66582.1 hypothetical protein CDI09_07640 [Komagataeibacter nataicola]WEQ56779.1 PAS domain-containing protein [Komagataeibacter nataicola]WNM08250.1 PAS domain-containing protein [Komagataeibacter nataicola]GBR18886.1 signal transduction histidine kinase [Komagataeibacter nataicola NRIC 0616]